jgi:5-methylcytosine-specific restriction endonuclease McrA
LNKFYNCVREEVIQELKPKRRNISNGIRYKIFKRDKYRCQVCGKSGSDLGIELQIDHKIPVIRGGTNDITNLWTLCNKCNSGKSAKDL